MLSIVNPQIAETNNVATFKDWMWVPWRSEKEMRGKSVR